MRCTHRAIYVVTLIAATLSILAGCDNGLGLVPAIGTVTLDKKPVAGVSVLFMPVGSGVLATGETDEQGQFVMRTANHDGARVGEYVVSLNKSTTVVKNVPGAAMPMYERVHQLPQKFSRVETSGLKISVSADRKSNEFNFDLESK